MSAAAVGRRIDELDVEFVFADVEKSAVGRSGMRAAGRNDLMRCRRHADMVRVGKDEGRGEGGSLGFEGFPPKMSPICPQIRHGNKSQTTSMPHKRTRQVQSY